MQEKKKNRAIAYDEGPMSKAKNALRFVMWFYIFWHEIKSEAQKIP